MKFKVTYTTVREFEIPEGATDEDYDAMKEVILAGIQGTKIEPDNVKVERIDVPAEPAPEYKINKDCD